MTYTIAETNLERQHLLAEFLEPVSLHALENISLPAGSRILDLGCGIGETTLMLSKVFPGTSVTGLDQDQALIEAAIATKAWQSHSMDFLRGDAKHLPFQDNGFDWVLYMLFYTPFA